MPVTLSDVAAQRALVTIDFPTGDLNIHYLPGVLTREMIARMDKFSKDKEAVTAELDSAIALLIEMVAEWDLMEDDGVTPIALNKDRLATVSSIMLTLVIEAIQGDVRPETLAP